MPGNDPHRGSTWRDKALCLHVSCSQPHRRTGKETRNITAGKSVLLDHRRMPGGHRGGAQSQLRRGWEGWVGLGERFPEAFALEGVNQAEGILSFPKDPSAALSEDSL